MKRIMKGILPVLMAFVLLLSGQTAFAVSEDTDFSVYWDPQLFAADASVYQNQLALLAAGLSWRCEMGDSRTMEELLKAIGVKEHFCGCYDPGWEKSGKRYQKWSNRGDGVFAIGKTVISLENEKDTTVLILVGRGTKTIPEAWSDATMEGEGPESMLGYPVNTNISGFEMAMWEAVGDFIRDYPIATPKVKMLICGHSLGGAMANLCGARITHDLEQIPWLTGRAKREDIHVYTFGAIKVLKQEQNVSEGYENIHNIYNYYDSFGPNGSVSLGDIGLSDVGSPEHKFGHTDMFVSEKNDLLNPVRNHEMDNYVEALLGNEVKCDETILNYQTLYEAQLISRANEIYRQIIRDFGSVDVFIARKENSRQYFRNVLTKIQNSYGSGPTVANILYNFPALVTDAVIGSLATGENETKGTVLAYFLGDVLDDAVDRFDQTAAKLEQAAQQAMGVKGMSKFEFVCTQTSYAIQNHEVWTEELKTLLGKAEAYGGAFETGEDAARFLAAYQSNLIAERSMTLASDFNSEKLNDDWFKNLLTVTENVALTLVSDIVNIVFLGNNTVTGFFLGQATDKVFKFMDYVATAYKDPMIRSWYDDMEEITRETYWLFGFRWEEAYSFLNREDCSGLWAHAWSRVDEPETQLIITQNRDGTMHIEMYFYRMIGGILVNAEPTNSRMIEFADMEGEFSGVLVFEPFRDGYLHLYMDGGSALEDPDGVFYDYFTQQEFCFITTPMPDPREYGDVLPPAGWSWEGDSDGLPSDGEKRQEDAGSPPVNEDWQGHWTVDQGMYQSHLYIDGDVNAGADMRLTFDGRESFSGTVKSIDGWTLGFNADGFAALLSVDREKRTLRLWDIAADSEYVNRWISPFDDEVVYVYAGTADAGEPGSPVPGTTAAPSPQPSDPVFWQGWWVMTEASAYASDLYIMPGENGGCRAQISFDEEYVFSGFLTVEDEDFFRLNSDDFTCLLRHDEARLTLTLTEAETTVDYVEVWLDDLLGEVTYVYDGPSYRGYMPLLQDQAPETTDPSAWTGYWMTWDDSLAEMVITSGEDGTLHAQAFFLRTMDFDAALTPRADGSMYFETEYGALTGDLVRLENGTLRLKITGGYSFDDEEATEYYDYYSRFFVYYPASYDEVWYETPEDAEGTDTDWLGDWSVQYGSLESMLQIRETGGGLYMTVTFSSGYSFSGRLEYCDGSMMDFYTEDFSCMLTLNRKLHVIAMDEIGSVYDGVYDWLEAFPYFVVEYRPAGENQAQPTPTPCVTQLPASVSTGVPGTEAPEAVPTDAPASGGVTDWAGDWILRDGSGDSRLKITRSVSGRLIVLVSFFDQYFFSGNAQSVDENTLALDADGLSALLRLDRTAGIITLEDAVATVNAVGSWLRDRRSPVEYEAEGNRSAGREPLSDEERERLGSVEFGVSPVEVNPLTELLPIPGREGYRRVPVTGVDATSYIVGSSDPSAYIPFRMIDGDETTSYQFSTKTTKPGQAYLYFDFDGPVTLDEMWIKNGFWKTSGGKDQYTRNCRVKGMTLFVRTAGGGDWTELMSVNLEDDQARTDWQVVSLRHQTEVTGIRVRIDSVYTGTKYKYDVCISEVMFVQGSE